jgi:hypothetical protein
MNCRAFERELLQQHQGMSLGVEAQLHSDVCDHCRLLYKRNQFLLNAVVEEKEVAAPPFLATRVMAGLTSGDATVYIRPVWKQALQLAAVLLALVGGYSGSVLMEQRGSKDDFGAVLTDYFLIENTGLTIEESWLYSDSYEN